MDPIVEDIVKSTNYEPNTVNSATVSKLFDHIARLNEKLDNLRRNKDNGTETRSVPFPVHALIHNLVFVTNRWDIASNVMDKFLGKDRGSDIYRWAFDDELLFANNIMPPPGNIMGLCSYMKRRIVALNNVTAQMNDKTEGFSFRIDVVDPLYALTKSRNSLLQTIQEFMEVHTFEIAIKFVKLMPFALPYVIEDAKRDSQTLLVVKDIEQKIYTPESLCHLFGYDGSTGFSRIAMQQYHQFMLDLTKSHAAFQIHLKDAMNRGLSPNVLAIMCYAYGMGSNNRDVFVDAFTACFVVPALLTFDTEFQITTEFWGTQGGYEDTRSLDFISSMVKEIVYPMFMNDGKSPKYIVKRIVSFNDVLEKMQYDPMDLNDLIIKSTVSIPDKAALCQLVVEKATSGQSPEEFLHTLIAMFLQYMSKEKTEAETIENLGILTEKMAANELAFMALFDKLKTIEPISKLHIQNACQNVLDKFFA